MATLEFISVCKQFAGAATPAVDGVSVLVPDGAFCVLLGPSGCGKSTLLRMVAGLEHATSGEVRIGGVRVNETSPKDRDIAMVFQNYALYPHLTVLDNIAFPLEARGVGKRERRARASEVARSVQLDGLLQRKPGELSGGQRQRVALARAIIREPKVFLFDEPLSNLDAAMRQSMRVELRALHRRLGVTSVYVTHDQEEALALADVIVVMESGRVRQVGPAMRIYHEPADRFVAGFVGVPAMNFLEGVLRAGPGPSLLVANVSIALPDHWARAVSARDGARACLGIRPSSLSVAAHAGEAPSLIHARVQHVELLGDVTDLHCEGPGGVPMVARVATRAGNEAVGEIGLVPDADGMHLFEAERVDERGRWGARICGGPVARGTRDDAREQATASRSLT